MGGQYLLGLDVGTTGCKSAVFDTEGRLIGKASYKEYPVVCGEPFQAEQDAEQVFESLVLTMEEAVSSAGIDRAEAVSVSVQGDAVMAVDRDFHLLSPVILGMDYRCAGQCEKLKSRMEEELIYDITGQTVHPINMMGKIMWFAEERPEIYEKAFRFLTYAEFIMQRLGGEPRIDMTMASRSMGMELKEKKWSEAMLKAMNIDAGKLSGVCETGDILGNLRKAVADRIGISNRPLLIAGAHDQTVSAVGAGVSRAGVALDSSGTAEVLSVCYREPRLNEVMRESYYSCYCHAVPGWYFSFAHMQTGGILLRWYRDNLGAEEMREARAAGADFHDLMQQGMGREPAGVLVLPHFNGSGTPLCDMDSRGAIVGLTLSTTRKDIYKGIMDGLAFELKMNLDTMKKAGIGIEEIRATGGGAGSPLWLQAKADITGCVFTVPECGQAGCLGAAVIAAVGAGIYGSFGEAVDKMVRIGRRYEPSAHYGKLYGERYEIYRLLYGQLKGINKELARDGR